MCATCGCANERHEHDHDHEQHAHDHAHEHEHEHDRSPGADEPRDERRRRVRLERDVLAKNDAFARENRAWLARRSVTALNLVSSPGAGKTTLLEQTIRALTNRLTISVLEGDQETERDAARIRATGARAIQINTGTGCHLDAHTVGHALVGLAPPPGSMVMIENVGNLVCPAMFDLGERAKVVILSVAEGDDKPLKYPHMFRASEVLIISKLDLLPHVSFDLGRCITNARAVQPRIRVFTLSATMGEGLDAWLAWLLQATPLLHGADRANA
jgi:hydrogenase nickel incorporation protein HypB